MNTNTEYFTYRLHSYSPHGDDYSSCSYTVPAHIDFLELVHDLLYLVPGVQDYGSFPDFEQEPTPQDLNEKINKCEELGRYESHYVGHVLTPAEVQACEQIQEFREDHNRDDGLPNNYDEELEPPFSADYIINGIVDWCDLLVKNGAL
jgi:hypothetical protein